MNPERRKKGMKHLLRIFRVNEYVREAYINEENWAKKMLHARQSCSCSSCGNRRYWDGITLQEKKSLMDFDEWKNISKAIP